MLKRECPNLANLVVAGNEVCPYVKQTDCMTTALHSSIVTLIVCSLQWDVGQCSNFAHMSFSDNRPARRIVQWRVELKYSIVSSKRVGIDIQSLREEHRRKDDDDRGCSFALS